MSLKGRIAVLEIDHLQFRLPQHPLSLYAGEARKAAAAFKPDAAHCVELGVVDAVVPEPGDGAHSDPDEAARLLKEAILAAIADVESQTPDDRRRDRRAKYRAMGVLASA